MDIGPLWRSHLERCLQDQFDICRAVADGDNDYPFEHRGAMYYVRLIEAADTWWVRVWAPLVIDVKRSAKLLSELNDINARYPLVRAYWRDGNAYVEANMHASTLGSENLGRTCHAVAEVAADVSEMLATVFGGHRICPPSTCDEDAV